MENLKNILHLVIYNNTVKEYTIAVGTLVALIVVFILVKKILIGRLQKWAASTPNDFDDFVVSLLSQIGAPTFLAVSFYVATLSLNLATSIRNVIHYGVVMVLTVRAILILQDIIKYSVTKTYRRARPNDPSAETVAKNIANVLRWAIWLLGTIFILDNLGVNISALVAGLGIGGVAVALAAQAILGDLFSALSIFLDKPFEVGDFIIIENMMGTVEYVGLKTTRIRSLSGEQLIFSNSDLTKSRIKNYKRMETRRIVFKVGVTYQTSLEKIRKIPDIIKSILSKIKDVKLDRAHFESFGDFSLNYEIVYFVLSADYNIYMDKQQEINFALKEAFEKEDIEFAYPTQTLYLSKMQ